MTSQNPNDENSVILSPSYRLPILIILIGLLFLISPFHPWPSILISSFGFFLLLQSFTLKLKFTNDDLIVMQLGKELRRFPFKNWIAWRILLPQLPGFLYFREEASPHLLPILFDVNSLEEQLRLRVKDLEIEKAVESSKSKT
ncbi:DUF3119 family protein [Prochlorococcus marinus]|uniref:DUF3119 domain-containing protein n=1 Tax=Prochlorococcus marinus XMU1408 TaxID=2213228 RepID=A0A318R7C8_PROMR|nr:DUF3119 family protein [Prochlorococcus marinus]MBW3042509.1 DUF3119 domain-containing protein [Prochlorococcus marinus str. XMU1408]PYE01238.1 DUF3119 domain-containing protein [Prochlorococcus marinus XMU1408]